MTEAILNVGILSFAHGHAYSYARALKGLSGVRLVGIYDDDPARGHEVAEKFATTYYTSAESLLAKELDGVIVCSENARHRALVEQAAHVTGSILCEKPIATTMADAQAMIDTCAKAGTRL